MYFIIGICFFDHLPCCRFPLLLIPWIGVLLAAEPFFLVDFIYISNLPVPTLVLVEKITKKMSLSNKPICPFAHQNTQQPIKSI